MSQFKFRLETLMKLRQADRQQRRAELAETYRADGILARQADLVTLEISEMRKRCLAAASPGRVDVDRLVAIQRFEQVLRAKARVLTQRKSRLIEEIEKRRLALVEADRQVRVLEKLRDRQLETHRTDELRREVKTLDEVALSHRRGPE
ncbi:MAG: flagellar FliJ family protein [Pirellulaceae bacterium]|jgi:flagellar export protein FliJ|nr:flagellar FliJ family protein [Pirellulaceae bacterium]